MGAGRSAGVALDRSHGCGAASCRAIGAATGPQSPSLGRSVAFTRGTVYPPTRASPRDGAGRSVLAMGRHRALVVPLGGIGLGRRTGALAGDLVDRARPARDTRSAVSWAESSGELARSGYFVVATFPTPPPRPNRRSS